MLGVSKTTPMFSDSLGGFTGLSTYLYSQLRFITAKGCNAKLAKGEGTWDEVCRKPGASFQEASPGRVTHALFLLHWVVTAHVKCCLPEVLIRDSVLRVLIWCRSHWHLPPNMYQSSTFPEGKQVSSINHTVCTSSLGTVLGMVGTLLKSKFPDASQGQSWQAMTSKDSSLSFPQNIIYFFIILKWKRHF